MAHRATAVFAVVSAAALLAGCSSGSSGGAQVAAGTTSAPAVSPSPHHHKATPTAAASPSASPTPIPAVTKTVTASPTTVASTAAAAAEDLVASPKVREALVTAGAKSHGLTAADYTGLVPGQTFYGYNPATSTYWAGAGLVPSSASMPAQVSVQDDGSYLLFSRPTGGSWSAVNVGLAGVSGATCPLTVPAGILAVWHWAAGTCRPPG